MQQYPVRWITLALAVGYAPRTDDDLATIRNCEVDAIVNLCAECYDLHDIEQQAGFEVYFAPIPDEEAPSLEDLEKMIAWMADSIKAGRKILVHCRFGIGRTGTLVAAYLMTEGLTFKEALRKMKHTPSAPMSHAQFKLLRKYSEILGLKKKPVIEAQEKIATGPNSFFKKWEMLRNWFESDENNDHK